jgi:hypothetical protein
MRIEHVDVNLRDFGSSLQGRILGAKHFATICGQLVDVPPGTMVVLDFTGVDYVTGSWLNAMMVPFFDWAGHPERDFFPVLRNVKGEWLDEVYLVANWNQQCYLIADDGEIPPKRARLMGHLEATQRSTLQVVLGTKRVTGAELARKAKERIGPTAWNNRLRDLYLKRLIAREKNGRKQWYYSIIKEIAFNGR